MKKTNNQKIKTSSALGEKNAVSGYYFQYKSATYLIIKYLKKKQLEWVQFIDPEAGKVDDLQLNISNVIHAYQMKWSESSNYISLSQILSSSHNESIIKQLAEGWKKLRKQYGNDIKVCFLTNMSPSKQDSLIKNSEGQKKSFKNFIEEEWNNRNSLTQNNISEKWKKVWKKIQEESFLSDKDFFNFIKNCEFVFSFEYPKEINSYFPEDSQILTEDIKELSQFILESISKAKNMPLKFTSRELLNKLNWSDRLEYKNIHVFPVEKIYEPILSSKQKLLEIIENIQSGYILLQGSPGSGKSSLLSESLVDSEKQTIIKYYCYIPDDKSISISRGESVNFFNDICKKLEEIGYKVGYSMNFYKLSFLQKKLHLQLEEISNKYQNTNKKVIIMIDGLDHIEREMSPSRSLLSDLPFPNSLPEGVIFLLSSQLNKLKNLPAKIEEQINNQDRKVIIDKLDKEAVLKVINKLELKIELNNNQKHIILEKCEGHPLALKLILKKISLIKKSEEIDEKLQKIDNFDQSIEKAYYSHWKQIDRNTELVRLLGLVSRLTEGIDWNWISNWENIKIIDFFKKELWYYFEEENEKWYFFHNSFRVFIERKTIEKYHGELDKNKNKDKEFHKILAKEIKNTDNKFEEIFHLYKAEAYQEVIDISTQQYFKSQIDNFCHPKIVLDNIRLSIQASEKLKNLEHIFNLTLSASTIKLIESYLFENESDDKLINLLLHLKKFELAQSYIRKRQTLLVPKGKAVDFVFDFFNHGYKKEAGLLLELSKPVEFLIDKKELDFQINQDPYQLVEDWLIASSYFYEIDKVCNLVLSLNIKTGFYEITENDVKAKILYRIGKKLIYKNDWNGLEVIFTHIKKINQEYYFHLLIDIWELNYKIDNKKAKKYFNLAKKINIKSNNSLLRLSYGYFFIDKKQSKKIVENISYPSNKLKIFNEDFSELIYRFKLIKLMTALNISFSLETLISFSKKDYDPGLVLLERNFGSLAILWGKHLSENKISAERLQASILPLIQFFYNKNFHSNTNWTNYSYFILKSRKEFFHLLISFIKSSYPNELLNIFNLFKSQWVKHDTKEFWENDIKRTIISKFFDIGCPKLELENELNNLEIDLPTKPMTERINDYFDHANLLIKFDQKEKVEKLLKDLINKSVYIGESKDYQLEGWIDWLELYNKEESNGSKNRIEKYIRYVQIASETTERSGAYITYNRIIQVATNYSPSYAVKLSKSLLGNGLSFTNYIDYLITALIKNNHISVDIGCSIIKNILLPVSKNSTCYALEVIIQKIKDESEDKIKERVLDLIKAINSYSFPFNRKEIKNTIIQDLEEIDFDWLKLEINWDDIRDTNSSSNSNELQVNGKTLNIFELERNINSIHELIRFKQSSSNSFFKWKNLIKRKKDLISKNNLSILREEFKESAEWRDILYILSDHFYSIGETNLSLNLAEELFENSKYYSWTEFYGERINSFKALRNHKTSVKFEKEVLKTLANDSQQFFSYIDIALDFDEIFKLVSPKVPIKKVWPFINEYLERLFSIYDIQNFPFPKINESETNNELPIEFQIILPLLEHPINLISQGAYFVMHDLFCKLNNSDLIAKTIEQASEEQLILLLNIIKGIIFYEPSKKNLVPVETLKQIQSNNFYIRELIQDLLKKVEDNYIPNYRRETNKTVPCYKLSFPEFPELKPYRLYGIDQYNSQRILPDSDNPIENIQMYMPSINELAEYSGIQKINLAMRTNQIMDELAGKKFNGNQIEKELKSTLKSQDLKLTYRRPRALIVRQAISHLISELVDINKIKQEEALLVIKELSYIDTLLLNLSYYEKPKFIQYNLPKHYDIPDNWIYEIINRTQLNIGKEMKSMVVIGEKCNTIIRDGEKISENIEQTLSFDSKLSEKNDLIQDKCLYQDYYHLNSKNILCCNEGIYFDTIKSDWIAINPSFMKKHGMKLSKEKPFTWLSSDGKIIAQTIFWIDGIIDHSNSYGDQFSQGAICLLDKEFFNKILIENKVYLQATRFRSYKEFEKSTNLHELYSK